MGSSIDDDDEVYLSSEEAKAFDFHILKAGNDLFKEESYKANKVVNVKRIFSKKNQTEDWHILEDKKIILVLKGARFSNAEKSFFRTIEGMKFIIENYKQGINNIAKFKNKLKEMF